MALLSNYWTLASFSLTILSAPFWPWMPKWPIIIGVVVVLMMSLVIRRGRGCIGIALALVLIITHGNKVTAQSNNILQFATDITIKGVADSFFTANRYGFSGSFVVRSINGQSLPRFLSPTVRLNSPIALQLGDHAQFVVQAKPIYGRLNEVGFDQEAFFLSQGWSAQATVRPNTAYQIIPSSSLRAIFFQQIEQRTRSSKVQGFILALTFGERSGITEQQWLELRNSGLIHLTAISGLHIGMAFGFGYLLGGMCSRLLRKGLWLPFVCGGLFALGYAWLAGFTLPTQRALMMCWLNILLVMFNVRVTAIQRVLLTLAAVLALDPFASLSTSFWLSFLAVSFVIYQVSIIDSRWPLWKKVLAGHLLLVMLMAPVTAYFFSGVSLYSALYNLVFIPWFSFVVVPLLFIVLCGNVLIADQVQWLWTWVEAALMPFSWSLGFAEHSWLPVNQAWQYSLLALFLVMMLRPLLTARSLIAIGLLFSTTWLTIQPKVYWQVDMLDVGHGLAMVIERNGRYVLYDTGSSWHEGSVATSLIIPLLTRRGGLDALDGVIISHSDNDHAGGLVDIHSRLKPAWIRASYRNEHFSPCIQGEFWQWQELTFEVVWPPRLVDRADNPHSCVVRMVDKQYGHSVLLTGDVTAIGEWLLSRDALLDSDVLVVPHHGSQTSSTQAFIAKVNPQLAIASLAKGHRWQLPHPDVLARYQSLDIPWLDTGEVGQITLRYQGSQRQLFTLRGGRITPWYRQMLRKEVE
ncbi:DNA internalization-related competence protein ComEC/Rec2 [Vibrio metschnikovii]|uniref:DNA internalization-related competence protein ComEC/Rec2 n=1 Tax=Vibrio metschnikovii TaxID=28172 RepID=UPI001C30BF09|nr:DNA internalization-related competence protein ComEC/Rec2 [Vibrio metschnikovii]